MKKLIAMMLIGCLAGCTTFYSSVVTLTQLRKDILNEYGELYRAGLISNETDYKAAQADEAFRQSARALEITLIAYKEGTADKVEVAQQLTAVKTALGQILILIEPLVVKSEMTRYNQQLATATKL